MKFDLQTSLGVLCAVTSLTCVGCNQNNGSGVAVQGAPEVNKNQSNTTNTPVTFTPSNNVPGKTPGRYQHTSHGAHLSHSSHASSRF